MADVCHHTCQTIMSTCPIFMLFCQLFMSTCLIIMSTCQKKHCIQQINILFLLYMNAPYCHLLIILISDKPHNVPTSRHNDLTCRHNYLKLSFYTIFIRFVICYVDLSDNDVILSYLYVDLSDVMSTCQITVLLSVQH